MATLEQAARKILRAKDEIAEREAAELARLAAEQKKFEEQRALERIRELCEQYARAKANVRQMERELARADAELAKFGDELPALFAAWQRFEGTPAHQAWLLERRSNRFDRRMVNQPGSPPPPRILWGAKQVRQLTERDLAQLSKYIPLHKDRMNADARLSEARAQVRRLESLEPALVTLENR